MRKAAGWLELRDRLRDRGRPSLRPRPLEAAPEAAAAYERVLPFAELMYLIMSADHDVTGAEREALLGALRALTDNQASTSALEQMMAAFERQKREHGPESRLDAVAAVLAADRDDRELAWALAAAVALADDRLAPTERAVLQDLADRLGISTERQRELLDFTT
jgi:tellurite resistance protein